MKERTVSLGRYPYTYARVSFMRSFLLRQEDYDRLLKMDLNGIIGFLEGSQYRTEIDELAVSYSGVELMEMALNRNLVNTWNKLKRISPKGLQALIGSYLERNDLWNFKTILRGKHTGASVESVAKLLLPAGKVGAGRVNELLEQPDVESFLRAVAVVPFESMRKAFATYQETGSILELENMLDAFYYQKSLAFASRIPSQGALFVAFIRREADVRNAVNVLRLRQMGVEPARIASLLKGPSHAVNTLLTVAQDEIPAVLSSVYGVSQDALAGMDASIISIELELRSSLLRQATSMLHKKPLSVDVILGYMFAKEVEVANLKLLVKSRQLGMEEEFIAKQLII
jgi:V/A-type H+/Na+-transporting ATPase subunit C